MVIVCQVPGARESLSGGRFGFYRMPLHLQSSTSIPSTTSSDDLWSNVPAPTPSNHAHWSSQLLSHLLTSSPAVAGRRIAVFPVQVRRAALIGYRQCHVMILVPPQRSGLRLCVSVCVLHPSWGDWHRFQSSRWGFGQVGMAVVLACAVSHGTHSGPPGFAFTQDRRALCGDRSVPLMGLVARARSCCSKSIGRLCLGHALQVS